MQSKTYAEHTIELAPEKKKERKNVHESNDISTRCRILF